MSYHARRILTPGVSRKRKERDVFFSSTSPKPLVQSTTVSRAISGENQATTSSKGAEQQPLSSNRILAGYMAYEFLSKGTLFGQKIDPARAEAVPVNSTESKRNRQSHSQSQVQVQPSSEDKPSGKSKPQSYGEVSNILKSDGAHIPGIVNPTQLARWIQM